MVSRQQEIISAIKNSNLSFSPAVAVDLDGTLVEVNTFHLLIRYLLRKLRREKNFREVAKIISLLLIRKTHLITHRVMKYPIHKSAEIFLSDDELSEFVDILKHQLNPKLCARLKFYKEEGYKIIIATAAPELYVKKLCESLGFDAYIATGLSTSIRNYTEARGTNKVSELRRLANEHKLEIKVVASDHQDDLPLLTQTDVTRILVNPTPQLKMQMSSTGLPYLTIC